MSQANRTFHCPNCSRQYQWKPELSGKRVKCKCEFTLTIPAAPDAPQATPTAPAAYTAPHTHDVAPRAVPPAHAPAAQAYSPPPVDDALAALASAGGDEVVHSHVTAARRAVHHLHLDPTDIAGLQRISGGLVIAIIAAVAWLLISIMGAVIVGLTKLAPPGSSAMAVGAVMLLIVGGFALLVMIVQLIAMIMMCGAPRDSGARGYMIAAIIVPIVAIILSAGLAIGLGAAGVAEGPLAASLLAQLMFGIAAVCYMLYHGALAKHLRKQRLGSQASYLTVLVIVVLLMQLIAGVCQVADLTGQVEGVGPPLPPGSEIHYKQAMFLGLPAAQAIGAIFGFAASFFGMITALWYIFAASAFRKGISKVIRQATHCGSCGYDLRTAPGPLCPNCGAERSDAYVHQAMMYAQQQAAQQYAQPHPQGQPQPMRPPPGQPARR